MQGEQEGTLHYKKGKSFDCPQDINYSAGIQKRGPYKIAKNNEECLGLARGRGNRIRIETPGEKFRISRA